MTDEKSDYYLFKIEQSVGRKNYNKAEEYLEDLEFTSPDSQLTVYEQAKLLYLQRQFEDAEKKSRELINLNRSNPMYWDLLGHCLLASGKFGEAQKCFEFVNDSMDSAKSRFMLGLCRFLNGDMQNAQAYLSSAYQSDSKLFGKLVLNLQSELFAGMPKETWKKMNQVLEMLIGYGTQ